MVLQQNDTLDIWGTDNANSKIGITTCWGVEKSTKSDKNGKWSIVVTTPIADNKEHQIWIKGSSKVHIKNVMLGEVWSGSVTNPVTVRYLFSNCGDACLVRKDYLLAHLEPIIGLKKLFIRNDLVLQSN